MNYIDCNNCFKKINTNIVHPYILIDNLTLQDTNLFPTEDFFWVGVDKSYMPANRQKVKVFRRCPVYFYKSKRVFLYSTIENGHANDFYYIPDEELLHIQKVD